MNRIQSLKWLALGAALIVCLTVGCRTTNQQTGEKEYDPVKTEQVKAAIEPVAIGAVRRIIEKNPESARYWKRAAETFTWMRDNRQFSPAYLVDQLDAAAREQGWFDRDEEWITMALDAKNGLIALYKVFYESRLKAELPEDQFVWHLTDVLANTLNRGIAEAGQ